jgi:hypothetical protein
MSAGADQNAAIPRPATDARSVERGPCVLSMVWGRGVLSGVMKDPMRIDAPLGASHENGRNTLQRPVDSINYPIAYNKQCTIAYGLPGKGLMMD